ncbi:hypothetical protein [Burkholderia sp. MSMB617WGS]|uniref:hypothetical protein n=1 Tax=Burkholderia sp. MSMB617WGS TaxID=1637831 RepID=UPI001646ED19|nr:hypothetical protein [Burkholderia sp. MSMB617WGS]
MQLLLWRRLLRQRRLLRLRAQASKSHQHQLKKNRPVGRFFYVLRTVPVHLFRGFADADESLRRPQAALGRVHARRRRRRINAG